MILLDITSVSCESTTFCSDPLSLMQVFAVSFLAILFLQSGLDKVFDWRGNLEWLKGHFAKSILRRMVPTLLGVITLVEVASGLCSAIGVVDILIGHGTCIAFIGATLSAVALLMLFFGQRIAKDYAGAGGLVPYFILTLATLYMLVF